MKGSRSSALGSELSGEPILRPCTGKSNLSATRSGSPTFDMHASANTESPSKEADALRAVLNNNNDLIVIQFYILLFKQNFN